MMENRSNNGNSSTNNNGNDSSNSNNCMMLDDQLLHKLLNLCNNPKVPDKATIRYEYVKIKDRGKGKIKVYGPYLYAYWRENGRLKKRYMGKSINDYILRVTAYEMDVDADFIREYRIMKWLAEHGDREMYTLLYVLNKVNEQALKKIMRKYKHIIYAYNR